MNELRLPTNVDVESLVLGMGMLYPPDMDSLRGVLEEDDFFLDKNKRIWRAICKLYDGGNPVDRVAVHASLMDSGDATACGGLSYLVSLDDGLPQNPNLDGYVRILKDKTLRRRIIFAAQNLLNRAMLEDTPVDDLLSSFGEVEANLSKDIQENKPISTKDLIEKEGISSLLSPRRHGEIRLPWKRLDAVLSGFSGGQIIVLIGETSRGKTSLALQAASYVANQNKTVLIWTMEMSPRSLFRRLVTQMSGVPIGKNATDLFSEDRSRQNLAVSNLADNPIYFDRHSRSVSAFGASVRQVRAKGNLGLVVVDYLQLIRSNTRQNRTQQVSENSRNLKLMAMDFNVPILVLSQVDRASVKSKDGEIGLHSAKEAGDIENDADVLLGIKSKKLARDTNTPVAISIEKQREGPAGFNIDMVFNPESQTFFEVADEN